jgi:hypothetical protein
MYDEYSIYIISSGSNFVKDSVNPWFIQIVEMKGKQRPTFFAKTFLDSLYGSRQLGVMLQFQWSSNTIESNQI